MHDGLAQDASARFYHGPHRYRAAMHKTELPMGSATTSSWLGLNDQ